LLHLGLARQGDLLTGAPPKVEPPSPRPSAPPRVEPAPVPRADPPPSPPALVTPSAAAATSAAGLAAAWKLVIEEVIGKRAFLGSVVGQATPVSVADGQLTVRLEGNPFNRNMLSERANRDIVTQAVRRYIPAATRFEWGGSAPGESARGR
jgi:hypothetical protein